MTRPVSPAVHQCAAQARHQVEEFAASTDMWLCTHDRDQVATAHAVQLLADYGSDPEMLAHIAAQAVVQLVEERLAAREARTVEPVMPPAAGQIRLAADYPDNQSLGGRPR